MVNPRWRPASTNSAAVQTAQRHGALCARAAQRSLQSQGPGTEDAAAVSAADALSARGLPPAVLHSATARCPELMRPTGTAAERVAGILDLLAREGFREDQLPLLLLKCPQARLGQGHAPQRRRPAAGAAAAELRAAARADSGGARARPPLHPQRPPAHRTPHPPCVAPRSS